MKPKPADIRAIKVTRSRRWLSLSRLAVSVSRAAVPVFGSANFCSLRASEVMHSACMVFVSCFSAARFLSRSVSRFRNCRSSSVGPSQCPVVRPIRVRSLSRSMLYGWIHQLPVGAGRRSVDAVEPIPLRLSTTSAGRISRVSGISGGASGSDSCSMHGVALSPPRPSPASDQAISTSCRSERPHLALGLFRGYPEVERPELVAAFVTFMTRSTALARYRHGTDATRLSSRYPSLHAGMSMTVSKRATDNEACPDPNMAPMTTIPDGLSACLLRWRHDSLYPFENVRDQASAAGAGRRRMRARHDCAGGANQCQMLKKTGVLSPATSFDAGLQAGIVLASADFGELCKRSERITLAPKGRVSSCHGRGRTP